ncbi:MAG: hypothetical protein WEF50_11185 [Myxococcota bacterium]
MSVAATTVYETRFRIEDQASAPVKRVRTEMDRTAVASKTMAMSFGTLARFVGPMFTVATAVGAIRRSLTGLNEQQNRTIQLAAQFNQAFKFDPDPAKQFAASMREGRKLVGGIISDAASLPGTSREFFGAVSMLAGPMFKAGKSTSDLRRLVSGVMLTAPFAGQSPDDAGRQAFRMVSGQAGIGDNPLFASLLASGLLPNAKMFNAMPLVARIEAVDSAFAKLTGNPFFRNAVLGTFDTQISTLDDRLFGPSGVLGQLLSGPFNDFVPMLMKLNEGLAASVPGIVAGLQNIDSAFVNRNSFKWWTSSLFNQDVQLNERARILGRDTLSQLLGPKVGHLTLGDREGLGGHLASYFNRSLRDPGSLSEATVKDALAGITAEIGGRGVAGSNPYVARGRRAEGGITVSTLMDIISGNFNRSIQKAGISTGELTNETAPSVTNTFHVRIDLKTDDSPEAIALKFEKAMSRVSWAPKRARRGTPSFSGSATTP